MANDHNRAPLPLGLLAWIIAAIMLAFGVLAWVSRAAEAGGVQGAPFLLFGALCAAAPFVSGYGAQALRRAGRLFIAPGERYIAGGAVLVGLFFESLSFHHAMERAGFSDPAMTWGAAVALPAVTLGLFWLDEAMKSAADELRAGEQSDAMRPRALELLWENVPALDVAGLELMQDRPDLLEAIRSRCASAATKAGHLIRKRAA